MAVEEVREIAARAGLQDAVEQLHPDAFIDKFGEFHLPIAGAEVLAKAFAVTEPQTVLLYIEDTERAYVARGREPGERFWHDYLREKEPGFALVRQWAGHQQEVEQLREEIEAAPPARSYGGVRPRAGGRAGPWTPTAPSA